MTDAYENFIKKFDKKRVNSDDCFTPGPVFRVVESFACSRFNLFWRPVVRPFYPGGDFETFEYPRGCVVIDNPPFSILKKIIKFYLKNGIDFFLFCDAKCALHRLLPGVTVVFPAARIKYDNGAEVSTAFITNLCPETALISCPSFSEALTRVSGKKKSFEKKP